MRDFDWQIIVTLQKTKNITKTSELLYISQPSLTKRIQAIEDELGVPLLIRSRHGSVLTPDGESIAARAQVITDAIAGIQADISARNDGTRGILRLGVPYSYSRRILPAMLEKYSVLHPDVEVDITTALSNALAQNVEEETLDLCFARYNAEDSYLDRLLVSEDRIYAVCPRPFELSELADMPCIEFPRNPATENAIVRWWNERFDNPPKVRFRVSNGDTALALVCRKLGFCIFADSGYFSNVDGVYSLPLEFSDGSSFTRRTWMLYKKSRMSSLARDFLGFVSELDINSL